MQRFWPDSWTRRHSRPPDESNPEKGYSSPLPRTFEPVCCHRRSEVYRSFLFRIALTKVTQINITSTVSHLLDVPESPNLRFGPAQGQVLPAPLGKFPLGHPPEAARRPAKPELPRYVHGDNGSSLLEFPRGPKDTEAAHRPPRPDSRQPARSFRHRRAERSLEQLLNVQNNKYPPVPEQRGTRDAPHIP